MRGLRGRDQGNVRGLARVSSSKLPLFIGLVVVLSFLLLSIVFRSIVIPLDRGGHEHPLHRGHVRDLGGGVPVGVARARRSGGTNRARSRRSSR